MLGKQTRERMKEGWELEGGHLNIEISKADVRRFFRLLFFGTLSTVITLLHLVYSLCVPPPHPHSKPPIPILSSFSSFLPPRFQNIKVSSQGLRHCALMKAFVVIFQMRGVKLSEQFM